MQVFAMIPARIGSERVRYKNLRMLGSKPLIAYAIEAAKKSELFDQVFVNTDFEPLQHICHEYGVQTYLRPAQLGSGSTQSDYVIQDFLDKNPCDYLFWVNPTSPFQEPEDLRRGFKKMQDENLDSLFTVVSKKIHSLYNGTPLNFSPHSPFPRSQDLLPVSSMVFSFMAWKTESFLKSFNEKGYGFINGKIGYLEIDPLTAIDIDEESDFKLAEVIVESKVLKSGHVPQYHPLLFSKMDLST